MAKVSAYTAASLPLAGTEELYVVQGGNGRKTTVDDVRGTESPVKLQTAVAAAGQTSILFSGIPSSVNRVSVHFSGYSTSGASLVRVQLGDAGGIETTGYLGSSALIGVGTATIQLSAGFDLNFDAAAANTNLRNGTLVFSRVTGDTWACLGTVALSELPRVCLVAGVKTLSAALTQLVVTTVNGTDTADAGSVSISWE
jgi:hypothetical protein